MVLHDTGITTTRMYLSCLSSIISCRPAHHIIPSITAFIVWLHTSQSYWCCFLPYKRQGGVGGLLLPTECCSYTWIYDDSVTSHIPDYYESPLVVRHAVHSSSRLNAIYTTGTEGACADNLLDDYIIVYPWEQLSRNTLTASPPHRMQWYFRRSLVLLPFHTRLLG